MLNKRNVTLTGKFSFIARFLLTSILLMTMIFSGYSMYLYVSGISRNMENFDAVLKKNVEASMGSAFASMASLRDVVDAVRSGGADTEKERELLSDALNRYRNEKLSEGAVLSRTGDAVAVSAGFTEKTVEVMTVSSKKDFTVKIPQQDPSARTVAVPVFLPLKRSEGYLYILWRPNVVAEKTVPWIGSALYSSDGTLLDSNISGLVAKTSSASLSNGKIDTESGTAYSSVINLPDGETSWWSLMVVEQKGMLYEALRGIIPVAVAAPLFFLAIFIPFRKLKKEVLEDLMFIRDIIRDFHSKGKVDVRIFQHARSHEVRQLGKMFIQMSEQISHSLNNLKNQADRDALTGLPNRVAMEKELQKRIDKEEMYSVLFLDLDGFKPINDNLGHEIGDVVLQSVGQKLMETFRNKDYVCRWGGDEFVVCLYGDVESVIPKLITRIRGKLAEINVNAMAGREDLPPYRVGASIGISTYPSDGVSVETLIQIADEKMYEDKVSRKVGR